MESEHGTSIPEQGLSFEVAEGVAWVRLDRPSRANAYTDAILRKLEEGMADLASDPEVRVVVVGSAVPGRFCAGADLTEMRSKGAEVALDLPAARAFDAVARCPHPVIAAVDGPAVGGGLELALACDIRVASTRAWFGLPETELGLLPAAGALHRLPALAGDTVAREMILFGKKLDAHQALNAGLVSEVVEPGHLDEAVLRWCEAVVARDPLALRLAKEVLASGPGPWAGTLGRTAQALLYGRRHGPGPGRDPQGTFRDHPGRGGAGEER